jgi:hypothetical protein
VLGLEYTMAVAEDRAPTTGDLTPYMHIFFRMDDGGFIAFFELPESPAMGRDGNTPKRNSLSVRPTQTRRAIGR